MPLLLASSDNECMSEHRFSMALKKNLLSYIHLYKPNFSHICGLIQKFFRHSLNKIGFAGSDRVLMVIISDY